MAGLRVLQAVTELFPGNDAPDPRDETPHLLHHGIQLAMWGHPLFG